MKKYPTHQVTRKQSVQGATLIEVLISVFLLTFGILGLMAAQLRSVSAVSESESRSIAAQAAENLAEAMQINPRLNAKGERDFSDYMNNPNEMKSATAQATCTASAVATISADSTSPCQLGSDSMTKQQLATAQLGEFQHILQQMPNAVQIKYTVCLDNPKTIKAATLSTGNCTETNATAPKADRVPVIKVVWTTLVDKSSEDDGVPKQEEQSYYLVVPQ